MDKNYVQAMIRFLENVQEGERISNSRGVELCKDYWSVIREDLKTERVLMLYLGGDARVKTEHRLSPTLAKYQSILVEMNQSEKSQKLADKNNLSGILSNWATFLVALWGAITGTLAILGQIFKWF